MLENFGTLSTLTILGIGLLFGLKHATEVDHVLAVSTIVSEHKNIFRSAMVGLLWGIGHTATVLLVGTVVLVFRIAIPERVSNWAEFGVALMIIGLGIAALWKALRRHSKVHMHQHSHDGLSHIHVHFHENETKHDAAARLHHTHSVSGIGWKPVLIGTVHGLAGSAALTLLVMTQISSILTGLLYLVVFGFGSIIGMVLMSGMIGVPFAFTSKQLTFAHHRLQILAALVSIGFGLWYAASTASAGLF